MSKMSRMDATVCAGSLLDADEQGRMIVNLREQMRHMASNLMELANNLSDFGGVPLGAYQKYLAKLTINASILEANQTELAMFIIADDSEAVARHLEWIEKQMELKSLFN